MPPTVFRTGRRVAETSDAEVNVIGTALWYIVTKLHWHYVTFAPWYTDAS